jgi:hypothetical protein
VRSVADDLGGFVGGEGIGKVSESLFNVRSELVLALVRCPDIAIRYPHGICWMMAILLQAKEYFSRIKLT